MGLDRPGTQDISSNSDDCGARRFGSPTLADDMSRGALIAAIRGYRLLVSPLFPPSCRFHPTCSAYAIEAIRRHGSGVGSRLALSRICRCHPWNAGGHDPVP